MADVRAQFAKATQALRQGIILTLSYLGELCVNHARSVRTYQDQTGNLRASIGYVIVHNGEVVKSNFTGSTAQGKQAGLSIASSLIGDIGQGWGLIVVAGMNYALAVESRGLDVLTTAEQLAVTELPGMLKQLSLTGTVA